jgi:3-hydroxyisobutyrate dehydrogenase
MKIGILGTGLMGSPLAIRLFKNNYEVIAYNRTFEKLMPLQEMGIKVFNDAQTVINLADCLILMLTNSSAIVEVLGLDQGDANLRNKTIIQMGTIAPDQSRQIGKKVEAKGGSYLEAPVLGSIPEAKNGSLLVMVGSTETQFQKYVSLLKNFSPEPQLIGEVGTASALKLALNQLISALTSGFALSLALVEKEGVNVDLFMNILRQSALYAPTFDKKLNRMLEGNFAHPNFPTKHLLKDTELFLNQAQALSLNTDGLEGIKKVIQRAIDLGLADEDYSAIYEAINYSLSR